MEVMSMLYEDSTNDLFGLDVANAPICDFPLSNELFKKLEADCMDTFRDTYFDDFLDDLTFENTIDSLFADLETEEKLQELSPFQDEKCGEVWLRDHHDCMWAGHCASTEHPVIEENNASDKADLKPLSPLIEAGAMPYTAPVATKVSLALVQPQPQQSLLKSSLRSAGLPIINMITPQTPPMSDDEDKQYIKQTQALKVFKNAEDYDDADQDLCDYLREHCEGEEENQNDDESSSSSSSSSSSESEDEDDEAQQQGPSTSYAIQPNVTSIRSNVYATENDHSYHKDKNASMRMANLGIDTPSDSEEEIDVVSVSEKKYTAASRMNYALPTNPSINDRRHLQRTVETAMGRGRRPNNSNGLKIMLPAKRSAASCAVKRKAAPMNERSTKRTRTYRRRANYDSESEQEPSEKRSLHNNMERQRRIDLRNAFEYLRQLVPEVLKKERAAKVVILREAAKYCDHLTYQSMSINKQVEDLKRHQERLRMRVSMLRRNLALKR